MPDKSFGNELGAIRLILLTIYLAGGKIKTRTRLQKLAFIVQKRLMDQLAEKGLSEDRVPDIISGMLRVRFKPYLFGPYSELLSTALEKSEYKEYISIQKPLDGPESYELGIKGSLILRDILRNLEYLEIDLGDDIINLNNLPLRDLLKIVYSMKPEFASKSAVKEKLKSGGIVEWGPLDEESLSQLKYLIEEGVITDLGTVFLEPNIEEEILPGRLYAKVTKNRGNRAVLNLRFYVTND